MISGSLVVSRYLRNLVQKIDDSSPKSTSHIGFHNYSFFSVSIQLILVCLEGSLIMFICLCVLYQLCVNDQQPIYAVLNKKIVTSGYCFISLKNKFFCPDKCKHVASIFRFCKSSYASSWSKPQNRCYLGTYAIFAVFADFSMRFCGFCRFFYAVLRFLPKFRAVLRFLGPP